LPRGLIRTELDSRFGVLAVDGQRQQQQRKENRGAGTSRDWPRGERAIGRAKAGLV
jgi:hypothetical protein